MRAFEQELGVALLDKQGLTEAGRQLLTQAPDILQRWQTATKEVAAASRHAYRHLRISLPETIMPLFLGPFLDRLNRTWPQIHIDLLDGTDLPMEETLRAGHGGSDGGQTEQNPSIAMLPLPRPPGASVGPAAADRAKRAKKSSPRAGSRQ